MIEGRQESILFFFSSGAQLCGQIPQSTNLQEERPCVTLITYNFSLTRVAFLRSLPNQIPSLLKSSLLQGGHRHVAQHTAPRAGDPVGN